MNIEEANDQNVTLTDFRPDGLVSSPSLHMYDVQLSDTVYIAIPVMCVVKIDPGSTRKQHLEAILKEGVVEFFSHPPANENETAFLLVKTTDALMTVLRTMFGILRLQESQLRKTCRFFLDITEMTRAKRAMISNSFEVYKRELGIFTFVKLPNQHDKIDQFDSSTIAIVKSHPHSLDYYYFHYLHLHLILILILSTQQPISKTIYDSKFLWQLYTHEYLHIHEYSLNESYVAAHHIEH